MKALKKLQLEATNLEAKFYEEVIKIVLQHYNSIT